MIDNKKVKWLGNNLVEIMSLITDKNIKVTKDKKLIIESEPVIKVGIGQYVFLGSSGKYEVEN